MEHLTSREMRALLGGVSALHSRAGHETIEARVFEAVRQVVPGDFFALDHFSRQGEWLGRDFSRTEPAGFSTPEHALIFSAHVAEHPLFQEFLRTRLAAPRKVTDFITTTQFQRLGIYNEMYRLIGVNRQMAVGFPVTPETFLLVALNRSRQDFTESDRRTLAALRPHLMAAYQNHAALARAQLGRAQLEQALDRAGVGAVLTGADGGTLLMTELARTWLARYFGARRAGSADELPEALADWLAFHVWRPATELLRAVPVPVMRVPGAGRCLNIRTLVDAAEGKVLLLLEEERRPAAKALEALGLTRREAEVLNWVAQGKTNHEIAVLCDISRRTVQKHLEHVFQKLGVETRTAAARCALDAQRQTRL